MNGGFAMIEAHRLTQRYGRGRLIAGPSVEAFVQDATRNVVCVRCSKIGRLKRVSAGPEVTSTTCGPHTLTVGGLPGGALSAIIRRSAGATAALTGIHLVLPGLGALLPTNWAQHINLYPPSNAGQAMAPWTGLSLFAGYTAALLGIAAWVLKRRDAGTAQ
ncbi:hypothetical protein [Streptomyces albiflavescens]|nr:hypothetical protein [Streptomyces albiflavescens]